MFSFSHFSLSNIFRNATRLKSLVCGKNIANYNIYRFFSDIKMGEGAYNTLKLYNDIPIENIRNFCIIAHVDHGKSTLADRLLEIAGCVAKGAPTQLLDDLEVERERGITVKAQTASMIYYDKEKKENFLLNLIDTPGHVDFSSEVSRSIIACNGALLLVDSTQGVQAQTIANYRLAKSHHLGIIPILTKLDLIASEPEKCINQLKLLLKNDNLNENNVLMVSAKTGECCEDIFPLIINQLSPPKEGNKNNHFRARILDSWYDTYQGVICLIQIIDGTLHKGDRIKDYSTKNEYEVNDLGLCLPIRKSVNVLSAGNIGYIVTRNYDIHSFKVSDTIYSASLIDIKPLPGFKKHKHMVFSSVYPVDSDNFEELYNSVNKLLLNDASVSIEKETSTALGTGLRCGFLGILHMEIFFERLEKEYDTEVIITAPSIPYKAELTNHKVITLEKASDFPDKTKVIKYFEPIINVNIITPLSSLKSIQQLMLKKRSKLINLTYIDNEIISLQYHLPWAEMVNGLYNEIIKLSSGMATIDYEEIEPQVADIQKVDILLNHEPIDALSFVAAKESVDRIGRNLVERLGKVIQRQQFEVIIQAAIGNKVFAKQRKAPYRKNVLEKAGKTMGGGDQTRKQKLLNKQKRGKKRMKMVGNIELPQEAFLAVLKKD